MTEFNIRPAKPSDAKALGAVIDAAYRPYLTAGLTLPAVSEGLEQAICDLTAWVAVQDARVVGGLIADLDGQAHIVNLAVAPDAAGAGLGRALLETAVSAARRAGHQSIGLATHVDMTSTQAFYRKQGWVETARERDKIHFALRLCD